MNALGWLIGKSAQQGAQTTVHACLLSQPFKKLNGKYLSDCREEYLVVSRQVGDQGVEDVLWETTEELLADTTKLATLVPH